MSLTYEAVIHEDKIVVVETNSNDPNLAKLIQLTMNEEAFSDREECENCARLIANFMTQVQMWNPQDD